MGHPWTMDGERRELTVNLAFSLVLHFLVFAGVFLTPSLYAHRFHVPVAYKVTLVDLPGTHRVPSSPAGKPAVKVEAPKVETPKAPTPVPPPSKAKVAEAKPEAPTPSPDTLALPKKQKVAPTPPKAPQSSGVSSSPAKVYQAPAQAALPAGPGGGGLGGVVAESGVSADNADPSLSIYLALIQEKVSSRWVEPPLGLAARQVQRVTLGFTVVRSGMVRDIQVLTPSGSIFLDQSALRAVQEAVPLQPFPPLFAKETLLVRFHFEMRGE
ncbi:MAG: TonB family protein [Candidatus Methylomirabilales bacterium]